MPATRIMPKEEREAVLAQIKPIGQFQPKRSRKMIERSTLPLEQRLGDLNEYRKHVGQGRAVVRRLENPARDASITNAILTRLRRLYPTESWSMYSEPGSKYLFLRFNGAKRSYASRQERQAVKDTNDIGLFSAAG